MSALYQILVQTDRLSELQAQAQKIGKSADVALVAARGAANFVKDYLSDLDESHPNVVGGPRTHFFLKAMKSVTNPEAEGVGASFAVTSVGFALLYYGSGGLPGGVVKPGKSISSFSGKLTRFLAIPTAATYGKTPAEVSDEQDIAFRGGPNGGALVQALATAATHGPKKGQRVNRPIPGGMVLFWLVTEANIPPHPDFLPSPRALAGAAADAAESYLAFLLKTGGNN